MTRRHHNNTGIRQIQRGRTVERAVRLAGELGVPCGNEYQDSASEAAIQAACVEYLTLRGWFVVETSQRWAADPRMEGLPDVLAWREGVTLLCETKTRKGRLRPSQVEFAQQIAPHVAGTLVYAVIRSLDELMAVEEKVRSELARSLSR